MCRITTHITLEMDPPPPYPEPPHHENNSIVIEAGARAIIGGTHTSVNLGDSVVYVQREHELLNAMVAAKKARKKWKKAKKRLDNDQTTANKSECDRLYYIYKEKKHFYKQIVNKYT